MEIRRGFVRSYGSDDYSKQKRIKQSNSASTQGFTTVENLTLACLLIPPCYFVMILYRSTETAFEFLQQLHQHQTSDAPSIQAKDSVSSPDKIEAVWVCVGGLLDKSPPSTYGGNGL